MRTVPLVVLHFLVACGLLWGGLGAEGGGRLGEGLRSYRAFAGLFRDYSYFAPSVASGVRVGFFVEAPSGTQFEPLVDRNPEVMRRIQCLTAGSLNDLGAREVIARSWAASALGRHPMATQVTVVGQRQNLPSTAQYRSGLRPHWETIYAADFGRKEQR